MRAFNLLPFLSSNKIIPELSNFQFSTSEIYLREDQANSATFDVKINKAVDTTINITSKNDYITFDKTSLTFSPSNWNVAQTVTVQGKSNTPNGLKYDDIILQGGINTEKEVRVIDSNIDSSFYDWEPTDDTHWETESELDALRQNTIDWVWGTGYGNGDGSIPTSKQPQNVQSHTNDSFIDTSSLTGISEQKKMEVVLGNNDPGCYLYLIIPENPNGDFIYNPLGHGDAWTDYEGQGVNDSIQRWISEGYYVMTNYMIVRGDNPNLTSPEGFTFTTHNEAKDVIVSSGDNYFNPMQYFLEPAVVAINYMVSNYNPANIYMTGLSGGGWMTMFLGALDQRIDKNFNLAGNYPENIAEFLFASGKGDWEQGYDTGNIESFYKNFRTKISNLDLYCMATQGREHYQWNNINDTCCFEGYYNTVYKKEVQKKLNYGGIGTFDAFLYDVNGHQYTTGTIDKILELI